jgi:hypothetical protein
MISRPGGGLRDVDLRAVDLLARLRLAADVRVVSASAELWALIELCGLREALGQPEEREQRLRVEEERHLGDLAADHLDDL